VSGNPGGRPKRPETIDRRKLLANVRDAACELTQDAIDTLASIMKDLKAPAATRVSAAVALLDRGHGRPFQAVDVKVDYDLDQLSDEELTTLARILHRAALPTPDQEGREITTWSETPDD
jgi:hypothetical protein